MTSEEKRGSGSGRKTVRWMLKAAGIVCIVGVVILIGLIILGAMVKDKTQEDKGGSTTEQIRQRAEDLAGASRVTAAQAWTLLAVQYAMLQRVRTQHPALAEQADEAQRRFQRKFGKAVQAIETETGKKLKELDQAKEYELTREKADSYLKLVEARARGELPLGVLKTLAAYQYRGQPEQELIDWMGLVYPMIVGPQEAPKSVLKVALPTSWDRYGKQAPNQTNQIFNSPSTDPGAWISFELKDLVSLEENMTGELVSAQRAEQIRSIEGNNEMRDKVLAESLTADMREGFFEDPESIKIRRIEIHKIPAIERKSLVTRKEGTASFRYYNHMYILMHGRYLIVVEGKVERYDNDSDEAFKVRQERWIPLFKEVVSRMELSDAAQG